MNAGTFMDIISVHYKDIRKLFTNRLINQAIKFDDDSFNDAFIKCAQHFGNEQITYDDAIKYFYVAFTNTIRGNVIKTKKNLSYDELDESIEDDTDDDDHTQFAKYFYDTIMSAITEAFNENDMMIYSLYKYNDWTKQDLIDSGYDCKNFDVRIKNIHRFVKEYVKSDAKHKIKSK